MPRKAKVQKLEQCSSINPAVTRKADLISWEDQWKNLTVRMEINSHELSIFTEDLIKFGQLTADKLDEFIKYVGPNATVVVEKIKTIYSTAQEKLQTD